MKQSEQSSNDKVSQKEAVYKSVIGVLKENGIDLSPNQNAGVFLNEEMKQKIYSVLEKGFQKGKVFLKDTPSNQEKVKDPVLLRVYIVGLVNNWLKRDSRLTQK